MKTSSPQQSEPKPASPKLIEIRCPFCVAEGRRAILGKVLKKRFDLLVQNALKSDGPDAIVDLIYYCRECQVNIVYGVIAV